MFTDLEDQVARQKVRFLAQCNILRRKLTDVSQLQKRLHELGEPVSDAGEDESDDADDVD